VSTIIDSTKSVNYRLPQIDRLLQHPDLESAIATLSRPLVTNIIRQLFANIRQSSTFQQHGVSQINVLQEVINACHKHIKMRQSRVINATGIIIHTNLGRSPIDEEVWQSVTELNTGYCNLELTLQQGKRGMRNGLLPVLVNTWIGAEDALFVNNNAAAVYLALQGLAQGKEVIVSRGEQIQIGGGFRIPDILAMSGCKLVEVGTTNITTADDYLSAITENTAAILMVHQSNFAIQGFTESPNIKEVAQGLPADVALIVDQGSGFSTEQYANNETPLANYLKAGADLVCFSGDKLLGGPQAGIIAGQASLIKKLSKQPMMRAFRCGRIVLSLLEALLINKLNQSSSGQGIAEQQLKQLPTTLIWAEELVEQWQPYAKMIDLPTQVGGGTLPTQTYPGYGIELDLPGKIQTHLDNLRATPVPIIGYLNRDKLILNLSTVLKRDKALFISQVSNYLASLA